MKWGIKKMAIYIIAVSLLMFVIAAIFGEKEDGKGDNPANKVTLSRDPETSTTNKTIKSKQPDFKAVCEMNAQEHPAKMGVTLVTKGDYNFTGMKYYLAGEIIDKNVLEGAVGNPSVWMVRNENGYVMPIQHDRFDAEIGDEVEIWGTLSGNGYSNPPGIDNVVGETGSMHAIMATINGEEQY